MAGIGPPPKAPGKRARSNGEHSPLKVVEACAVVQPDLPEFDVQVSVDGDLVSQKFVWPEQTRRWWSMWGESPLSADFTQTDWDFLLDTARIHAAYWSGDLKQASELRLRVAKFGATPEDRARLRIAFSPASDAADDARVPNDIDSARSRRNGARRLSVGE
ncbi:MAG: hypothetical protein ABF453_02920 [Bifidobacterium psychraerophilum]|uniref:phage terminase small subunit n=1 Tax=Bifidobacterium psychraerophilum TaxID=218140 RepID=UPI0039EC7C5A